MDNQPNQPFNDGIEQILRVEVTTTKPIKVIDLSSDIHIQPTLIELPPGRYTLLPMENPKIISSLDPYPWFYVSGLNVGLPVYEWEKNGIDFC